MKGLKLATTIVLVIMLAFGTAWTALASNEAPAIHTTNEDGTDNTGNFLTVEDVYFKVVAESFEEGNFYVRVTNQSGRIVYGESNGLEEIKKDKIYNLYALTEFTTNVENGKYQIWISTDPEFSNSESKKTDVFIVQGIGDAAKGTLVINKTLKTVDGVVPHAEVIFNLHEEGIIATSTTSQVYSGETNEDGKLIFVGLDPGDFRLEEVISDEYENDLGGREIISIEGDQTTTIEVINKLIEEPEEFGSLTVKYVDEEGEELSEAKVKNDLPFGKYTEEAIEIEGYMLMSDETQSVTLDADKPDQEIVFVYEKIEEPEEFGSLTVKYIDEEGEELSEAKVLSDLKFGTYTETAINIEGYMLKGDETQSVTLDTDKPHQEIVFVYEKIEIIEEEEEPLGPIDPKDPEDEEVVTIEDEEEPLGGAKLPQTGGLPSALYYGAGAVLIVVGGILRRKK